MLSNRAPSHQNHSISTSNIDHLITEWRLTMKSKDSRQISEKDQIQSIRKIASFILQQPNLHHHQSQTKDVESKRKQNTPNLQSTLHKKDNIKKDLTFNHPKEKPSQINQKKNSSNSMKIKTQISSQKINNCKNNRLYSEFNDNIESKNAAVVISKVKGPKVNVKQNPSLLNYKRHNRIQNNKEKATQAKNKSIQYEPKRCKKQATRQQVNKIFEGITDRGKKVLQNREARLKIVEQQRQNEELKGYTFNPQLIHSNSIRKISSKGFLQRLKDDAEVRQKNKAQILSNQLKKTTFKPMINQNRSQVSNSKVDSFRSQKL